MELYDNIFLCMEVNPGFLNWIKISPFQFLYSDDASDFRPPVTHTYS